MNENTGHPLCAPRWVAGAMVPFVVGRRGVVVVSGLFGELRRNLETRVARESPGPHQEGCGGEVDGGLGGAVGLHVVLVERFLCWIERAGVAVEFLEGVFAIGGAEDHSADHSRSCVACRAFGGCAPEDWDSAGGSVEGAGKIGNLMLDAVW